MRWSFRFPFNFFAGVVCAMAIASGSNLVAAEPLPTEVQQQYDQAVSKAIDYLQSQGQAADGSFSGQSGPAVTALVATSLQRQGRTSSDPLVAKALKYIEGFVQKDGGVYGPESTHKNYETSIAVLCFKEANRDGRYDTLLAGADAFLKGLQWGQEEGADISDPAYGGAGYGSHARPDLSNTSFLIDALIATGNGPDDPAIQKALVFVSRCQNFESAANTSKFAALNPDGGFYYTIAAGGSSQAGETENGGLRSYGSMTYAGLKSMIYAGVDKSDPRVQAAINWLKKNYTLESNPGMGDQGLYYFYHTGAKALAALDEPVFTDAEGTDHAWRTEIVKELLSRQADNGSWVNETERWMEGDPNLVTGYALLTLAYCRDASGK